MLHFHLPETPAYWARKAEGKKKKQPKNRGTKKHSHIRPYKCEHYLSSTSLISEAALPETGSVGLRGWRAAWMAAFAWGARALSRWADPCWSSRTGPKPLFSCCLPCGLNGFCSPLFPSLAADRSGISLLLPMASADEVAVLWFCSSSLERSKWPARTQLATCPSPPGGPRCCL